MLDRDQEQELLLQIVETWRPSAKPEYRGFHCASCQEYKNEAWYHWLNKGDYRLPVHMCNDKCEPLFRNGQIQIDEGKREIVDRSTFGNAYSYSTPAIKRFRQIVDAWPEYEKPKLKTFSCDDCGKDLDMEKLPDGSEQRQGYHVWWEMGDNKTLAELHFHKSCGDALGVNQSNEVGSV